MAHGLGFDLSGRGQEEGREVGEDQAQSCRARTLAKDEAFWSEQVRHPAVSWMAAGGRGAPAAVEAIAGAHFAGFEGNFAPPSAPADLDRKKQANRDKQAAKKKRLQEQSRRQREDQGSVGLAADCSVASAGRLEPAPVQMCLRENVSALLKGPINAGSACRRLTATMPARSCENTEGCSTCLAQPLVALFARVGCQCAALAIGGRLSSWRKQRAWSGS